MPRMPHTMRLNVHTMQLCVAVFTDVFCLRHVSFHKDTHFLNNGRLSSLFFTILLCATHAHTGAMTRESRVAENVKSRRHFKLIQEKF